MGRKHVMLVIALAAMATAAGACGGSNGRGTPDAAPPAPADAKGGMSPSAGAAVPGGGLSIEEAIASELPGPLMVTGYLVVEGGDSVRLCSMLAESYPPQCGGPSLTVIGLDLESVQGLTKPDDPELAESAWSEEPVSVLGDVDDGVITVSGTSI